MANRCRGSFRAKPCSDVNTQGWRFACLSGREVLSLLRSRIQRFPSSCRPSLCDPRSCQEHAHGPARWDLSCLGTLAGSKSVSFIIIPARGRRAALLTPHHCYIHSTVLRPTIYKPLLLPGPRRSVVVILPSVPARSSKLGAETQGSRGSVAYLLWLSSPATASSKQARDVRPFRYLFRGIAHLSWLCWRNSAGTVM
jgi:hypothetical protein